MVINKYYHTAEYIANNEKFDKGARKRRTVKREVFVATDRLRSKYNTEEIMKELKVSKSDSKRFAELVGRFRLGDE